MLPVDVMGLRRVWERDWVVRTDEAVFEERKSGVFGSFGK